jgi:purine-binding chemotaxis protein CheW
VIPVIDLHKRFALPDRENSNETRVMVLNVDGSLVGAIVDSVTEVLSFTDDQIEPAGSLSMAISTRYVTGVAKLENRLVILLDYVKVFAESERRELVEIAEVAAT